MVRSKLVACTLALVLLNSSLLAIPVIQTDTNALEFTAHNHRQGALSTAWFFDGHNPALGSLSLVTIDLSWEVLGSAYEINPFTAPPLTLNWTPYLSASLTPLLMLPSQPTLVLPETASWHWGPTEQLAPGENATYTGLLTGTARVMFSAPADLALFTGTDPAQLRFGGRYIGENGYGGSFASGNATMTITYHVPDNGATAALLMGALALVAMFSRRRQTVP